MDSRERLLNCIRHRPVDRVPVSTYQLVGWNWDSWENREPSYKALMDAVREHTDCIYMFDPDYICPDNPLQETYEWDEGKSRFTRRVFHTAGGDLESVYRADRDVHTVWTIKHPLQVISDIGRYLSMPYEPPEADMGEFYTRRELLGDKGLMMITVRDPICDAAELFEMSAFLTYAITERERIKYLLDALHERQMHSLRSVLRHGVNDVIFRICGPEYATPPYLSPACFHDFVACYLSEICGEIKAAGGIPRIHSHGKIARVIDQFAATEAEALDPIEPPPDGDMELAEAKRLYGKKLCLFGNIELRELEFADRERIDLLVKSAMDAAKEGSGFVLTTTASPIDTPLKKRTEENYLQMIESAMKYGKY